MPLRIFPVTAALHCFIYWLCSLLAAPAPSLFVMPIAVLHLLLGMPPRISWLPFSEFSFFCTVTSCPGCSYRGFGKRCFRAPRGGGFAQHTHRAGSTLFCSLCFPYAPCVPPHLCYVPVLCLAASGALFLGLTDLWYLDQSIAVYGFHSIVHDDEFFMFWPAVCQV